MDNVNPPFIAYSVKREIVRTIASCLENIKAIVPHYLCGVDMIPAELPDAAGSGYRARLFPWSAIRLLPDCQRSMSTDLADHLAENRTFSEILALPRNALMGSAIEDLLLIAEISAGEEFKNRIRYIPL